MPYTFKHGDRPLGDYTIQRAVGSGGFGEVYYAVSDGGREVALKYLKQNPQIELRGVSHCINLKSPHLVSIFDVKKNADGEYFIIMEYCSGSSLRDLLIAEPEGFGPQKAAFFVREIAKGLAYLHDRGIVHRDLKPGNIFYDDGYVKIGDYGLSKFISVSRHSAQTASVGTVHYMAPEIGSGNYSRGVDIYALGVMLYEMLLGKVPFEGSTMAEVLMKHLTAQPELDDLPQPFGDVIRKTLQKNPNDRFKNVSEMIEALLEVEHVRKSLDGFSAQSLDGAVRRGGEARAPSPVPSPNPPPGGAPPFAKPIAGRRFADGPASQPGAGAPLPDRLAKRLDRISRRVEQRMAKLAGRKPRPLPPPPPSREEAGAGQTRPPRPARRRGSKVFPLFLLVGLAVALGVLVGNGVGGVDSGEAGLAAGLLTVAMSGGLALSRRAVGWFGIPYGKNWASRVIHAGCCTPLLAIGALPMFDSHALSDEGLAVWLGLLLVAVLADWPKQYGWAAAGRMSFGSALWVAFGALVATAIAGGITGQDADEYTFVAAGIAGIVALVVQASGLHRPAERQPAWAIGGGAASERGGHTGAQAATPAPAGQRLDPSAGTPPRVTHPGQPTHAQDRLRRWDVTRAFWGIFSFLLIGGAIITGLLATMGNSFDHATRTGILVGCAACFSVMIFAIRKTTPISQPGFLREWFKPFLITISVFGIASLTVTIVRHWPSLTGDERALVVAGSVVSGLMFGVANMIGGKRHHSQPFLVTTSAEGGAVQVTIATGKTTSNDEATVGDVPDKDPDQRGNGCCSAGPCPR